MDNSYSQIAGDNKKHATFEVGPLARGFGITIGNGLRRTLLQSTEGAAPTNIKIEGVQTRFGQVPGAIDSMLDVELNLKGLRVRLEGTDDITVPFEAAAPGPFKAGDIDLPTGIKFANPSVVLFTVIAGNKKPIRGSIRFRAGRGYVGDEQHKVADEAENLPLDAKFTPVTACDFSHRIAGGVEYAVVKIETDGSRTPEAVLVEAAQLMVGQLAGIAGNETGIAAASIIAPTEATVLPKRGMPVTLEDLDLPMRIFNCLKLRPVISPKFGPEGKMLKTIADLLECDGDDLLGMRNLGKKTIIELANLLREKGFPEAWEKWEKAISDATN